MGHRGVGEVVHTRVGLCKVGWVMLGWGGSYRGRVVWESCSKTSLKNDSPQNQDFTPPKSFLEGVQISEF